MSIVIGNRYTASPSRFQVWINELTSIDKAHRTNLNLMDIIIIILSLPKVPVNDKPKHETIFLRKLTFENSCGPV